MPRKIAIDDIEPGMTLAEPVKRPNGAVLLGKGIELNESYINKLRMMDVIEVVVEGEGQDDLAGLLGKIEKVTTSDDAVSQKIAARIQTVFSKIGDNKIMQAIMIVAQKTLIERERKRLEGL